MSRQGAAARRSLLYGLCHVEEPSAAILATTSKSWLGPRLGGLAELLSYLGIEQAVRSKRTFKSPDGKLACLELYWHLFYLAYISTETFKDKLF